MRGGPRAVSLATAALVLLAACGGTTSSGPGSAVPAPTGGVTSTAPTVTFTPVPAPPSPTPTSTPTPIPGPPSTPPSTSPTASPTADCSVPAVLSGQDLERMPVEGRLIALTFDGGSGAQGAAAILDTLAARDVPAAFFLTGQFVRTFPTTATRIGGEHLVGNHTDTHPDLTTLGEDGIIRELRVAERAIAAVTGQDPRRFFRFPFGARDTRTIAVVNDLCYVPFRWTVDTLGWKGTSGGQSVDTVVDRVLDGATPGGIVLMHVGANPDDGSTLDADALQRVISGLRAAGYRLVALDEVLDPAP